MRALALLTLAALGTLHAAEEKTADAWIEELSATYAKLDGYIATYHSGGENKSLDVTVALDEASSRAVIHTFARKDGETVEFRQWTPSEDELYMDAFGQRVRVSGARAELESIVRLVKEVVSDSVEVSNISDSVYAPAFWLKKDTIEAAIALTSPDEPTWRPLLSDAEVDEVTDTTIRFRTPTLGLFSISRENGLMVSQSITGKDGEERTLRQTQVRPNPGTEALAALSKDWSTLGAKAVPLGLKTADSRRKAFQLIIDETGEGRASLTELDATLKKQEDRLRTFASSCLTGAPDSIAGALPWKKMLDSAKDYIRKEWTMGVPEAVAKDDAAFRAHLASPEVRETTRNGLVQGFEGRYDDVKAKVLSEFFGTNPKKQLEAEGEVEQAALDSIERALYRAYFEAAIDQKMAHYWGEREGLR